MVKYNVKYRSVDFFAMVYTFSDNTQPAGSKASLDFGFFCSVNQNLEPASAPIKFSRSVSCQTGRFVI